MFCIECGQELPTNAKFCCRCGTSVNNISKPRLPIMDDVAARAEDVVITDEMPSLDMQSTNDDVLRKASFVGYSDESISATSHYVPTNESQPHHIENLYPKVSKTTFFGGELTLVKTEHSKDDFSYYFEGQNIVSTSYAHIYRTDVSCIFVGKRIDNKKSIYLRWDFEKHTIIQDILDCFDSIGPFVGNYAKVENDGKIGYVYYCTDKIRINYAIECKHLQVSFRTYFDYRLTVFAIDNYFVTYRLGLPEELFNSFQAISKSIFKVQKRGDSFFVLLRWDDNQSRLINSLPTYQYQYISDVLSSRYIKVKENGKYGFIKIYSDGNYRLLIPCIFDCVGEWGNYDELFLEDSPQQVVRVQYKGNYYFVDDYGWFYNRTDISRFTRATAKAYGGTISSMLVAFFMPIVIVITLVLLVDIDVQTSMIMFTIFQFVISCMPILLAYMLESDISYVKVSYVKENIETSVPLVTNRKYYTQSTIVAIFSILFLLLGLSFLIFTIL